MILLIHMDELYSPKRPKIQESESNFSVVRSYSKIPLAYYRRYLQTFGGAKNEMLTVRLHHEPYVCEFSPFVDSNEILAIGNHIGGLRLYKVDCISTDVKKTVEINGIHHNGIQKIKWAGPDCIVTSGFSGMIQYTKLSPDGGHSRFSIPPHFGGFRGLDVVDEKIIAVADDLGNCRIHDIRDTATQITVHVPHLRSLSSIRGVSFLSPNHLLIGQYNKKALLVWDIRQRTTCFYSFDMPLNDNSGCRNIITDFEKQFTYIQPRSTPMVIYKYNTSIFMRQSRPFTPVKIDCSVASSANSTMSNFDNADMKINRSGTILVATNGMSGACQMYGTQYWPQCGLQLEVGDRTCTHTGVAIGHQNDCLTLCCEQNCLHFLFPRQTSRNLGNSDDLRNVNPVEYLRKRRSGEFQSCVQLFKQVAVMRG